MDKELEFDKQCRISLSPKTVLPLNPRSSSNHKEVSKGESRRRDQSLIVEGGGDIRFECYKSESCRIIPSRFSGNEDQVEFKRGSVYQASREVREMKRKDAEVSRRKIEFSQCGDRGSGNVKRPQDLLLHPALITAAASMPDEEACSSDGFFDIDIDWNDRQKISKEGLNEDLSNLIQQVGGPVNDGNILLEEDEVPTQVQDQLESPPPSSVSQSVDTPKSCASSKSRLSPIKKIMDPFLKSKYHRSPLSLESGGLNNEKRGYRKFCNETLKNHPTCNLPKAKKRLEYNSCSLEKDHYSGSRESPTLLHACLTLRTTHGTCLFEFNLKCPEISFLARPWKRNLNDWDLVYTFHSVKSGKRWDFSRWGSNKHSEELPIVGQMQVSSRLSPESSSKTVNSLVTEFVLYDMANNSERNLVGDNSRSPGGSWHVSQLQKDPEPEQMLGDVESKPMNISDTRNLKPGLHAYPWEQTNLHPNMESAAILIHIPLEKGKVAINSPLCDSVGVAEVIVVTPDGSHGLPDDENKGPSQLFDRWRQGGGCECGGWDMGCPLSVLSNPVIQKADSHTENNHHFELIVQGARGKTSTLSIKSIEEGRYIVAFHARLSALQAFAICVAILHGSESSSIQNGKNSEPSQRSPLNQLTEQEISYLLKAFTGDDENQVTASNKESHLSFAIDPPISPISRV